jgi:hypothetical protein
MLVVRVERKREREAINVEGFKMIFVAMQLWDDAAAGDERSVQPALAVTDVIQTVHNSLIFKRFNSLIFKRFHIPTHTDNDAATNADNNNKHKALLVVLFCPSPC